MEANEYEASHVDSDVLLPPRKRLLAGMKRQSSESPSQSSIENSSPAPLSDLDIRLQNLLKLYKSGPRLSSEELARAAGSAAAAAANLAAAARAAADAKAAVAAKAMAAAKDALSLLVIDRHSKKNKMKKHVPVQLFYQEQQSGGSCGTDEEMARKLHRAINSSPRISKHSPRHKKKPKVYSKPDVQEDADSEETYEESIVAKVSSKFDQVDSHHSKERVIESSDGMHNIGRKRGRVKQKKLSLSLCSFKDKANPKDGPSLISSEAARPASDKSASGNISASPSEPHASKRVPIDPSSTWKRKEFKAAPVH